MIVYYNGEEKEKITEKIREILTLVYLENSGEKETNLRIHAIVEYLS